MSTWITNMTHFPKPHELSKRMPMALIKTTLEFGAIVKMGSQGPSAKQAKHSCGGEIEAKLDSGSDKILWRCKSCGDDGEINQWRSSGWDTVPEEDTPKLVVVPKKARARKKARSGTLVLEKKEFTALKNAVADPEFDELFSRARLLKGKAVAVDLTIEQLDGLYCIVGDLLDYGPSRQRKMWDETLNAIAWTMDEIAFAEAAGRQRK